MPLVGLAVLNGESLALTGSFGGCANGQCRPTTARLQGTLRISGVIVIQGILLQGIVIQGIVIQG
jgi:hypothetical protein